MLSERLHKAEGILAKIGVYAILAYDERPDAEGKETVHDIAEAIRGVKEAKELADKPKPSNLIDADALEADLLKAGCTPYAPGDEIYGTTIGILRRQPLVN